MKAGILVIRYFKRVIYSVCVLISTDIYSFQEGFLPNPSTNICIYYPEAIWSFAVNVCSNVLH